MMRLNHWITRLKQFIPPNFCYHHAPDWTWNCIRSMYLHLLNYLTILDI